jgi:transposase
MVRRRDFRKLDPATQAELRRVAVAMVAAGKTRVEAAAAVGVNRRFVGGRVKTARRFGDAALAGGRRGRRPGEQKALSPSQERKIRRLITDRCPDQLRLPSALWTRGAVGALIAREAGVRLSASALGRSLRAWGFTAQRPARRATERREPEVRAWLRHEYPAIAARAKAEGAEIHWADETGLSNQANYGRSFAPRGKTPVLPRPAARVSQSMISSLTNRGTLRFMVYDGALTAATFLVFLRRLVKGAGRKLFVIVDNLRVHRARRVTAWARANQRRADRTVPPPALRTRAQPRRVPQQRRQASHGATSGPQGQGLPQGWPHLLHARPATPARQGPRLLPGPLRPLRGIGHQRYVFGGRLSS